MQGIKFTSGTINKRVNEKVESYSRLLEIVRQLFNNKTDNLNLWYINNGEKLIITSDEDFEEFLNKTKDTTAKVEVCFEKKGKNFEYILENVGMSESYAIYDRFEKPKEDNIIVNGKVFEEKAVQNKEVSESKHTETFIETNEIPTNTVIVNHSDKEIQVNNKDKEVILSKIDEILSSKLKIMEDKFELIMKKIETNSFIYESCVGSSKLTAQLGNKQSIINDNNNGDLIQMKPIPDPTFTSLMCDKNEYFTDEFCSRCNYQIMSNKYICMLCEDYKLCSQCEKSHTEHPLLKININCKTITQKEDLVNNILSKNNSKEKKGIIKTITNIFNSDSHLVHISANCSPLKFAMPLGEKLIYNILVQNAGKTSISQPLIICANNNKNLIVKDNNKIVPALDVYENREIEFLFEAPSEAGVFYPVLTAYGGGKNLKVEPVSLEIHVVEKDLCEVRNAELYFSDYEEALDLPDDKKVLLYKIVDERITELAVPEIIAIMKRHSFDLLSALDELTRSQSEESL
jgi:hypothetical protein